jgi:hypothetical protein
MVLCHCERTYREAELGLGHGRPGHPGARGLRRRGGSGGAVDTPRPCQPIFTDRARRKDLARWVRSHSASILSPFWARGSKSTSNDALLWPRATFWGLLDVFGSTIIDRGDAQVGHRARK